MALDHEQFPSMQMTQKRFEKWMQILAGENSSGATTESRIEIQREQ